MGLSQPSILATFLQATGIGIPVALLLAGLGGWFLARRSFASVVDMGRRASAIDSESLDARLTIRNTGDEMDELATVFNDMLGRLERSFLQQRQFMADASHELRTPLATLRAEASVTLSQRRTNEEYEASLEQMRDEARRLSAIVDDLFTLARLDAEDGIIKRREFYLEELVMECVGRLHPLAQDRGLSLSFQPSVEAPYAGDPDLIDRVITNLLDNATKYTPRGGAVRVELERRRRLSDSRKGRWDGDPRARALPRYSTGFPRRRGADASGDEDRRGGAWVVHRSWKIARAHGGDLVLSSSDESGSVFTQPPGDVVVVDPPFIWRLGRRLGRSSCV